MDPKFVFIYILKFLPLSDRRQSPSLKALDLDTRLACWRIKLQKLYKNEHDEGLTYVGPMGPLCLTPAMVLDWCRALVCFFLL